MTISKGVLRDAKTSSTEVSLSQDIDTSVQKLSSSATRQKKTTEKPTESQKNVENRTKNGYGTQEVQKSKDGDKIPPVPITKIFRYASPYEVFLMIVGITAALVGSISMPIMTVLYGRLIEALVDFGLNVANDTITMSSSTQNESVWSNFSVDYSEELRDELIFFATGSVITLICTFLSCYIFVAAFNYTAEAQVYRLRQLYLTNILRQEIGWFDTRLQNDFASRVTEDLSRVREGLGESVSMFIFHAFCCLFSVINAFWHGWQLTLVMLSVYPLLGLATGLTGKLQQTLASVELNEYAKAGGIAEEVFSAIRTVTAYGGQDKEVERYEQCLLMSKVVAMKRGLAKGIGMGLSMLVSYSAFALGFWYGSKLVFESRVEDNGTSFTAGDLNVVYFSVFIGAMRLGYGLPHWNAFSQARVAAASIYEAIERKSNIDPSSGQGSKPDHVEGTIDLKNVRFSYPSRPEIEILKGVTIRISPGKTVALVGSSGCGKSTCIQLIQRFYEPHSGSVTLDGNDIRDLNLGWLRDQIGIVGQEPVLFATTIAENIRYGRDAASFLQVQEAAKEANAHDFIMKLPKNYHTQVGDRGVQMSGGQKQRIAIARALIKRPKILLLDEATSALDNESEAVVQRALDKARQGRTTIVVAHRLSTVKSANLIVVMKDGEVVESGTHDQLMAQNGHYKTLVVTQLSSHNEAGGEGETDLDINEDTNIEEDSDEFEITDSPNASHHGFHFRSSYQRSQKNSGKKRIKKSSKTSIKNKPEEVKLVPVKDILKLNSPEWAFIVGGVLAAVVEGFVVPVFAIFFGEMWGTLSEEDINVGQDAANLCALVFLLVGIFGGIAAFVQAYMFSHSGETLTLRLRKEAFVTMLRQDMGWFDDESNSVGALCSRLSSDASAVQGATGTRIGVVIKSVTTIVAGFIIALVYNLKLGAVAIACAPITLVAVALQSKVMGDHSPADVAAFEDAQKIAMEVLSNIRTVAGLHREEKFVSMYSEALFRPHIKAQRKAHIRGLAYGIMQSLPSLTFITVMVYGIHLVVIGELEFPDVFKVAEAVIFGTMVVGEAMAFAPNYGKAKVAASRLIALFNRKPAIDTSEDVGVKMTEALNRLNLKDVEFSYPTRPTQPILKGMNMEVAKGKTVALVGSSGCGKSTVINLLERFYDAKGGSVTMNENDIQVLNVGYTRSLFGLVSQEPVLFDRTISENIAYGDNTRSFSQEDIEEVAKQANIHTFIKGLPNGYDTRIGAKGTQLSGGQKQRIAIARALIRNPQVLLLDEATSALDAESEKIVQQTLENVQHDRTSIIIAHRLSTIRHVNMIIVLKSGVAVEQGTHEELLAKRGYYWQLYNSSL